MLSQRDTDLLCQVGPGTPMGNLLRRFWLPVALTEELPTPDCTPVAVRIMGEDLVLFRDTAGRPGVIDGYCPHRHAHLYWGRNEEGGCIWAYMGPKDLMPSELPAVEWSRVPDSNRISTKRLQLSNWAQAVE